MGEPCETPVVSTVRFRRLSCAFNLLLFAVMMGVSAWAHLSGLSREGIDDVDSAALYRMLTHRLPSHDLSYFGGYVDGVSMPSYLWGRYSYLLALWAESWLFTPSVYFVYLHNAILGILISVVLYRSANRFIGKGTGPFAGIVFALGGLPLFYTRHLKDFAFTLLFLALGMHLLCVAWKRRGVWAFFFAGITLGVAATANYAALPAIAVVLGMAGVCALYDAFRRRHRAKDLLRQHAALAGGLLLIVLAVEAFAPVAAYYFPFWEIPPTWGYFKGLFAHQASAVPHTGSYLQTKGVWFYVALLWREGYMLALPAAMGVFSALLRRAYRTRYTMLYVAVLVAPIALYSLNEGVASLARNVLPSYLGFAMVAAMGYRELANLVARLARRTAPTVSPALARNAAHGLLLAAAIAFSLPGARYSMLTRSGAEQIRGLVGTDRACITAPDEFAYHWTWYYFPDERLACRTWEEVADRFLNDRSEFLVVLPERYTRWESSPLAQWNGPPYCSYLDRFDFPVSGPARAYDLHEPSLLRRLGLGETTVLVPSNTIEVKACRREEMPQLLRALGAGIDVSVPDDGVLELRGRVQSFAPGDLLFLAVGTPDAPLRYYLEVIPPRCANEYLGGRTPWTSIQTCFRVRQGGDIRITLACITSEDEHSEPLLVDGFSIAHYTGESALGTPKLEVGTEANHSVEHDATVARIAAAYPRELPMDDASWTRWGPETAERVDCANGILTVENRGHTVLQPAGAMWSFKPGEYRPGAVYRVTFRGRTNRMQEGEVDLVIGEGKAGGKIVRKRLGFWKPWWCDYSFDFIAPPDGGRTLSILFREARAPRRFGKIETADISVREIAGGATSIQGPDDEIDFRSSR